MALSRSSSAQCYVDPYTGQQICTKPLEASSPSDEASAHCRITVGDGSTGSGTLVARNDHAGLVLTCSHLFDRTTTNVTVAFPDGQRFAARVLERDRPHDLAALVIHRPDIEPVAVFQNDGDVVGAVSACGFGSDGRFRCVHGDITGRATAVGAMYPSLIIHGSVRPGDSGGAVLNTSGRLVGVVWGERNGQTYATCGRPLRELLARVIGEHSPTGNVATGPISGTSAISDLKSQISDLGVRLRDLDATKQSKGDYALRSDLNVYARRNDVLNLNADDFAKRTEIETLATRDEVTTELKAVSSRFDIVQKRIESVRESFENVASSKVGFFHGLSFGKLIAGALGLSGPLAASVVIAGGLAGKRAKRRLIRRSEDPVLAGSRQPIPDIRGRGRPGSQPVAVDTPPPPQRTVTETHYVPYEIDSFAKAHQWASEQVTRKYPGATELLQAQDSLIKQYLAAK